MGYVVGNIDGVKFPATQVPSSDANTLDDYEEGTATVTVACGTSGTVTLDSGTGNTLRYTKIGNRVFFNVKLSVGSVSSPLGTLRMAGLPFTVVNANGGDAACAIDGTNLTAGATTALQAHAELNTTTILISTFAAGAASDAASRMQANSVLWISGHYAV